MPRGTALPDLVASLRAEIRDAQDTDLTTDANVEYIQALAKKQRDLANRHDWTFLEDKWDLTVPAGSRYLAIPTSNIRSIASAINFARPVCAYRFFNSLYTRIDYGISVHEMNYQDSDAGDQLDAVQRWSIDTNTGDATNANQVEVWPIPSTAQKIRFVGQRTVRALAVAADLADLDDDLLVYFVAADYLALRDQTNAVIVQRKAQEHLLLLRASYPVRENGPITIGTRQPYEQKQIRAVPLVIVAP